MSRASFRELFQRFYGTLEDLQAQYIGYGGVAVAIWAEPRETQDVDAVVSIADEDLSLFLDELQKRGFSFEPESARTLPIDGWLRMQLQGRHADISLGRTPFDKSALSRRQRVTLFGMGIWIASAEDLLLYKLIAYRYKDLADVEAIILRQGKKLNVEYLRTWADEIARHTSKFEIPRKLEELLGRLPS